MPFFGGSFAPTFLERGIKNRHCFWSPLSKYVKSGNFVISGYCLVPHLCFGVYFSPIFLRIGYHLKTKTLEPGKGKMFPGYIPVQI